MFSAEMPTCTDVYQVQIQECLAAALFTVIQNWKKKPKPSVTNR